MTTRHLRPEELSALLDDALAAGSREGAERHLEECAACREDLAALGAQEEELRRSLTHDPGDAYFERFSARVGERIRAEGLARAPERAAAERARTPRSLAWIGAVAGVVVAVGVVFLVTRESQLPHLRDERALGRVEREAAPAPAPAGREDATEQAAPARPPEGKRKAASDEKNAPTPAPASAPAVARQETGLESELDRAGAASRSRASGGVVPGRAYEVRKNELGEDVPVRPQSGPAARFATPPPPAPSAAPGEPVTVRKETRAQPMKPLAPEASNDKLRDAPGASRQVCGEVRDPAGRPVANASVVLAETGAAASTDAGGRFCLGAPAEGGTLAINAIGFAPARRRVPGADDSAGATIVIEPVAVMAGKAAGRPSDALGTVMGKSLEEASVADPTLPRSEAFAALPESLKALAREASLLARAAAGLRSAASWELAADRWSRLVLARPGGSSEDEAMFQLGAARLRAWELAPDEERREAAFQALETYMIATPRGPRLEQVKAWRKRVEH